MFAACLAIVACSNPQEVFTEFQEGPYTVTSIEKNVYHIQDCNGANPSGETFDETGKPTHFNNCSDIYLLAGSEKALLIDLSNDVKWADNAAESLRSIVYGLIGDKPLEITFTHNHGDHTGMLPAFIAEQNAYFMLPSVDFSRLANRFPEGKYEFYDEGYEFNLGDMNVSTVMVPGHTNGSMVFSLVGKDLLMTGDAIGSGHGVWIFNEAGFENYKQGIEHLMDFINDKANAIDTKALRVFGGHYWQKDWFPELKDTELGMQYILDMQQLVSNVVDGTAEHEPSGLSQQNLDTYYRNGLAIIAGNHSFIESSQEN